MKFKYRGYDVTQQTTNGEHKYLIGKSKKMYESIHLLDMALDKLGAKR